MANIGSIGNIHVVDDDIVNQKENNKHYQSSLIPLTKQFWNEVIGFEQQIAQKSYSFCTIGKLIQLYAKAVEHYDKFKDPITNYFMEKLQSTIASKDSLRLILQERELNKGNKDKNENATVNTTIATTTTATTTAATTATTTAIKPSMFRFDNLYTKSGALIDELIDDEGVNDLKLNGCRKNMKKREYKTPTKTRFERSQFVNMYMKVENTKKETENTMIKLLNDHAQSTEHNDVLVRKNIDDQLSGLRQKIHQRRVNTLLTRTSHFFEESLKEHLVLPCNPAQTSLANTANSPDKQGIIKAQKENNGNSATPQSAGKFRVLKAKTSIDKLLHNKENENREILAAITTKSNLRISEFDLGKLTNSENIKYSMVEREIKTQGLQLTIAQSRNEKEQLIIY